MYQRIMTSSGIVYTLVYFESIIDKKVLHEQNVHTILHEKPATNYLLIPDYEVQSPFRKEAQNEMVIVGPQEAFMQSD